MEFDAISSHIRQEIRQYDEARRYLTDQIILLPSFTLQETSAICTGRIELPSTSRLCLQAMCDKPRSHNFLGMTAGYGYKRMVHFGFAVMTNDEEGRTEGGDNS
jgi:hypothetical protein